MVPGHPPCALISLIFSSLSILRPIVSSTEVVLIVTLASFDSIPFTPFATGLILNHSLCSCQGARFATFQGSNPEDDTDFRNAFL